MFERFTPEARQVVVIAQEEARRMAHDYIGTEHILLGLLRDEGSVAGEALAAVSVELEDARAAVVAIVGEGEHPTAGQIPFTPRAKKVMELSLREALGLGHDYIGSEHILLGLIRERDGVAAKVLWDRGVDLEALRRLTIELLSAHGGPPPGTARAWVSSRRVTEDAWLDGLAGHLDELGREIRAELGREPDAGDLLLALACAPETVIGRALRDLGVDRDELWGRIESARRARRDEQAAQEREIAELRSAKEAAIASREFARAAELRDSERELGEAIRRAGTVGADELHEIRRRLGLPGA